LKITQPLNFNILVQPIKLAIDTSCASMCS